MFNLKISKRDDSGMITTRNKWTINGKVIKVRKHKKGFWLTVKTKAKLSQLYSSDELEFDCFLSNEVSETAYKKESYLQKLHAAGKFVFRKDECYFMVERLLV